MSWEKLAQNRIEEAIAAGEFDDLPGRGQPLDLSEYFSQPTTERMGAHVLRNANVVPSEVEQLKQIATLETALATCTEAARKQTLQLELQEKRVAFALAMERRKKRELP